MKRFHFSLRTLLIAVAIVCVGLGLGRHWYVHATTMLTIARKHEALAQRNADIAWGLQRMPIPEPGSEQEKQAQEYWGHYSRHKDVAAKFRRAAWWPFSPSPKANLDFLADGLREVDARRDIYGE